MILTQTTPAAELPVTLEEVKDHLTIDYADDDDIITSMLGAAVSHLDGNRGILHRCIVNQSWRADFACWDEFRLPFPDVSEFSISYLDENGDSQDVSDGDFRIANNPTGPLLYPVSSWSAPALLDGHRTPISVTFTAGFGAASDVPEAIKVAIKMHAGSMYDNRNSHAEKTSAPVGFYNSLISPFRWVQV